VTSVEPEHMAAIDAVPRVGNIGAHMEKDIDLIIEVDPGEAQDLIGLIEMLFDAWYVARSKRQDRLAAIVKIAEGKDPKKLAKPEEPLQIGVETPSIGDLSEAISPASQSGTE
jgi:hypothetical protein